MNALTALKEIVLRENYRERPIANWVNWMACLGLGSYAATQASRIHKFAPLAITGGMWAVEMIDSREDEAGSRDLVSGFKTSGVPLTLMRGFVLVTSGLSLWKTYSVLKHAVKVGGYTVDLAKDVAITLTPALLEICLISKAYRNHTIEGDSSIWRLLQAFDRPQ